MGNGKAAKRLQRNGEKSERIRVALSATEWEAVEALVAGATEAYRTDRACRSACLAALLRAGLQCLQYHTAQVAIPEEEAVAVRRRFRQSLKRGMGRLAK